MNPFVRFPLRRAPKATATELTQLSKMKADGLQPREIALRMRRSYGWVLQHFKGVKR